MEFRLGTPPGSFLRHNLYFLNLHTIYSQGSSRLQIHSMMPRQESVLYLPMLGRGHFQFHHGM
jgi:hypothetical protein